MKLVSMKKVTSTATTLAAFGLAAMFISETTTTTEAINWGSLGDILTDALANITGFNVSAFIGNETYWESLNDTSAVLDDLFDETNTTEAWESMKDYLEMENRTLAPDGYFGDILTSENIDEFINITNSLNGTIDWNADAIIDSLMNATNLTETWEAIKANVSGVAPVVMPAVAPAVGPAASPVMTPAAGPVATPVMTPTAGSAPVSSPTKNSTSSAAAGSMIITGTTMGGSSFLTKTFIATTVVVVVSFVGTM